LKTSKFLPELGYIPQFFLDDGFEGKPTYGPFDKILVTAGAKEIPVKLLQQLKVGGRMVIPHGDNAQQTMLLFIRKSESEFERSEHGSFAFVPLLKGIDNQKL